MDEAQKAKIARRDVHLTSVTFQNFKAFKHYSIGLTEFNVLVGPNNSGKSTIIAALRILEEAMMKARHRAPEVMKGPGGQVRGYRVDLEDVPIAAENVFTDYDDTSPASVRCQFSNGYRLLLLFREPGSCSMFCEGVTKPILSPATFTTAYPLSIEFVPVLGPVEHREPLYTAETARRALLSHRAARHFRNTWYHFRDGFDDFRSAVRATWPGMDISAPQVEALSEGARLFMFCTEARVQRELYWAGFGFQVWCQILTYLVRGRTSSLFVIDEPDIYLHADLQRQLLALLKDLPADVLMATHSTEIVSEADAHDIVVINKERRSAQRLQTPTQVQRVFDVLGSNLNPTLTQLAKTRRVLFVEGKDYQLLSAFAKRMGKTALANRSDFAVIAAGGFKPEKVESVAVGIEETLGARVLRGAIFDRDYRSEEEAAVIESELRSKGCELAAVHKRKELENFLLVPTVLERSIKRRLEDAEKRGRTPKPFQGSIEEFMVGVTDGMREPVQAQVVAHQLRYWKRSTPRIDESTALQAILGSFESIWRVLEQRLMVVPGKETLTEVNRLLNKEYGVSLTPRFIVSCFQREEVPEEMRELLEALDRFRGTAPPR